MVALPAIKTVSGLVIADLFPTVPAGAAADVLTLDLNRLDLGVFEAAFLHPVLWSAKMIKNSFPR